MAMLIEFDLKIEMEMQHTRAENRSAFTQNAHIGKESEAAAAQETAFRP